MPHPGGRRNPASTGTTSCYHCRMSRADAEVEASALDEHGAGVAQVAGVTWHVADLLPGERAEVARDHQSPHRAEAWGHVVQRLNPAAPDRVAPACPRTGRCGGCTWQHLAYPAQLIHKQRRVEAALAAVPALATGQVRVAPVVASPRQLGYRNKGKYVIGHTGADRRGAGGERIVLGAFAPRTHQVVDTLGCRVVAPILDEVATWARAAIERSGAAPYDERTGEGELRYLVVRASGDDDVLAALIVTSRTSRATLDAIAQGLVRHPALRGLVVVRNDRRDGAILPAGSPAIVLHGVGAIVETLFGARVEVGAGEFVQVNRDQAQAMYRRVVELAEVGPGARALDLYAGLGGIGLGLARAGAEVVAIEVDPDAVAALGRAARAAGLSVTAEVGDAAGAVRHGPVDVVVVNPPRKGLGEDTRRALVALAPARILYVSCGPESLGRDLVALAAAGYQADVIEPFDLMPGTGQVETVVRLRRAP